MFEPDPDALAVVAPVGKFLPSDTIEVNMSIRGGYEDADRRGMDKIHLIRCEWT